MAALYDQLNLSYFSVSIVSPLLDYALGNDWLGQRIFDFGCGTGQAAAWLAEDRFNATGIDSHAGMLAQARARSQKAEWQQADVREMEANQGRADMVIAFELINEQDSIKDIKAVFESAYATLDENGWFVFDMLTMQGVAARGTAGLSRLHQTDNALLLADNTYDWERMIATHRYTAFIAQGGGGWSRTDTQRVRQGYPVPSLSVLLQRVGFRTALLLDTQFRPLSVNQLDTERVIFVAHK